MTVRRTGNPPTGAEPGLGRAPRLAQTQGAFPRGGGRRGPREILAALGAIVALAALLVGVPYALLTVFGSPIPDRPPSVADLTQRMGESALITVLVALVWLAWLQFALCVVVEVYAAVRGIGVPARVPLAGGTQSLVHRLVVTALLLFTATTAVMPAFTGRELHQQRPVQTQAQELRPVAAVAAEPQAAPAEHAAPAHADAPERSSRTTKIYRVQPPEGRHHESLWEIADKCLGDGRRYKEIYALNKGRVQPDGSRLTIASLIRPGWILEMPEDAVGAKIIPVEELDEYFRYGHAVPDKPAPKPRPAPEQGAPEKPAAPTPAPSTAAPGTPSPQTPGHQAPPAQPPAHRTPAPQTPAPQAPAPAPSTAKPVQTPAPQPSQTKAPETPAPATSAPATSAPATSAPATSAPATSAPATSAPATSAPHTHAPRPTAELGGGADTGGASVPGRGDGSVLPFEMDWPHGLAAASLLAAGLLGALGRRRRVQMWHRAAGHMIKRPEGAAARAEQALRIGADEDAAHLLDLGLRHLSRSMAAEGRALPTVYAVHLGSAGLDLWISPADPNPPAPWQAYDDGQVWRLRADALPALEAADLGDVLAPYPGLVSIGTNPTGRILVDLEAAHGLIALNGPPDARRSALAAIALELAVNRWSDHMRITLVGFDRELGAGLAEIAPDRIRVVDTLDEALPELEGRSEEVRQALAASGVDSVLTGRCRGLFGEAWMPHYLIMAERPTEREADRLVALARTGTRMAAGYLVAGEVQGATWTWELDAAGRLHAGVLGFEVQAQLIPQEHYRAVVDLFRTAGRLDPVPLPDVTDDRVDGRADDRAADRGRGDAAEPPGTGQSAVDIRLLGPIEIDAPGPIDESRRELCTEILVYLATHPNGVHPTVLGGAIWPRGVSAGVRDASIARVSDWLGRDARGRPNLYYDERGRIRLGSEVRVDWAVFRWLVWRSAAEPASETAYMSYALDLVRGPVLADRPRGRYGWLADDDLEYEVTARVIDVAHRLAVLRLDEGDARGAVTAARAGLRLAPDDEGLWRDLLRATHATGDETQVRMVVDEMRSRLLGRSAYDELQPETEALIEELVPSVQRAPAR